MGKRIETIELSLSDINFGIENPRKKLTSKKKEELKTSLENHGDFGVFVVDENHNMISGHQRYEVLKEINPESTILCKKLIGYSESELKAINIKCNTHVGEWDIEMLAKWTADIHVDLGFDLPQKVIDERKIKDMELIRYEKYDYVMIVCKNEIDYLNLQRTLGLEGEKVMICQKKDKARKIKARAIWYDKFKEHYIEKNK